MSAAPTSSRLAELRPGALIGGKFRLERLLGEGGIGLVYVATHLELDEPVALKFMRDEMMHNASIVERFAQEARAAVKLKSEHVARVLDVGRHGSTPFMVMEMLEGRDMQRMVSEQGPMDVELAVELTVQACEALAEAHGRGIVHRDVKPENLFVVERDGMLSLKVLDFGISKVALGGKLSPVDLRSSNEMLGSPYYMSPEQIRATHDVDHRADLWSLGATLFEVLTGRTAFAGNELADLMNAVVTEPHRALHELRPDLPLGLEQVIDRCLAKRREDRFQSAGELALALLPFTRKRARSVAERAVTLTRSGGIDPGLQMPPSLPPPANGLSAESGSIPALRVPSVPHLALDTASGPPSYASTLANPAPDKPARGRATTWIAVAALLLLVGVALVVLRREPIQTENTAAGARGETPVPSASATPAAVATATAATPPPSDQPVVSSSVPVSPPSKQPASTAGAPRRPAPSKPAPSHNPDLEIRRER